MRIAGSKSDRSNHFPWRGYGLLKCFIPAYLFSAKRQSTPLGNIMRTFKVWPILTACVAAYAIPLAVNAQQANGDAPPQLERLEEGEAPAVTIREPEQQGRVIEKRDRGGRVSEVEVTRGKSTYYLRPNTQAGSAMSGDGQSNTIRAPQWRIGEFDLRRSDQDREAEARAAAGAPPPPAPAQSAPAK
jgi:hypothetical protein